MKNKILKLIKKTRVLKELSQKDIAKKLHMSIPSYSRFESGITKTDYQLVLKICKILEIDTSAILTENFIDENNNEAIELSNQIKEIVLLLEKQNEINALILQKLIKLNLAS